MTRQPTIDGRPAPRSRVTVWRVANAAGMVATATGVLLLAFAAYQLWGTGHYESRAQAELSARLAVDLAGPSQVDPEPTDRVPLIDDDPFADSPFPDDPLLSGPRPADALPADAALVGGTQPVEVSPVEATVPQPAPAEGEPFAVIRIPAIGLDKTVVGGTGRDALRSGPGHYRGTALPGRPGNVAIAGHRTTYGAPFRDLDQLVPGDEIVLETTEGAFTYRVEDQAADGETPLGHRIVSPDEVGVIADRGDNRVTLTACHPLYSARERIVVTAVLVGPALTPPPSPAGPATVARAEIDAPPPVPAADPVRTDTGAGGVESADGVGRVDGAARPASAGGAGGAGGVGRVDDVAIGDGLVGGALVDDLGWQPAEAGPTIGWAAVAAAIATGAWVLGRRWRRWPAYAVASPTFTVALLTCFAHLDRLLPAA